MDISFSCSHCSQELQIDESAAGTEVQCPTCQKSVVVPVSQSLDASQSVESATYPQVLRSEESSRSLYYKHSGHIGALGLAKLIATALVGTLVACVIYAYGTFYIPFVYLNFLFTFGYGLAVGFLVVIGAKLGKVRSPAVVACCGFGFGLFAEYANWVAWLFALSKQSAVVVSPLDMLTLMQRIAEKGVWSVKGLTPTGTVLYLIWVMEALIIIGVAGFMSWRSLKVLPFCERCNQWVDQSHKVTALDFVLDPDALRSQLERGEFVALEKLKRTVGNTDYTELELMHCPSCQDLFLLSVTTVVTREDSKGREEKTETTVVENLLIDSQAFGRLKQCGKTARDVGAS